MFASVFRYTYMTTTVSLTIFNGIGSNLVTRLFTTWTNTLLSYIDIGWSNYFLETHHSAIRFRVGTKCQEYVRSENTKNCKMVILWWLYLWIYNSNLLRSCCYNSNISFKVSFYVCFMQFSQYHGYVKKFTKCAFWNVWVIISLQPNEYFDTLIMYDWLTFMYTNRLYAHFFQIHLWLST